MNKKFSKAFIKHYNTCFLTLKRLVKNLKNSEKVL